jgi:hypothetical protein
VFRVRRRGKARVRACEALLMSEGFQGRAFSQKGTEGRSSSQPGCCLKDTRSILLPRDTRPPRTGSLMKRPGANTPGLA